MKRHLVFAVMLVAGSVILAEGVLRQSEQLPSLQAEVVFFRPKGRPAVVAPSHDLPGCRGPSNDDKPVAWVQTFGAGSGAPLRMLVAGDSITLGDGVEPHETYAAIVAMALSKQENRPVEVVNAGVNAAGYCHVIRAVHRHLEDQSYDQVLVGLFADDLEQRAITLVGGQVRADPSMVDGPIGSLASQSYVFNWLWLKQLEWIVSRQTDDGRHPPAHVTRPGRTISVQTMDNFRRSIDGVLGYEPWLLLIPPVGGPLCSAVPEVGSECDWLGADMDRMVQILSEYGERFVDLRALWRDGEDHTQALEQRWWREHGRLPVHPNAAGHARLGNAVVSAILKKKPSSKVD